MAADAWLADLRQILKNLLALAALRQSAALEHSLSSLWQEDLCHMSKGEHLKQG